MKVRGQWHKLIKMPKENNGLSWYSIPGKNILQTQRPELSAFDNAEVDC